MDPASITGRIISLPFIIFPKRNVPGNGDFISVSLGQKQSLDPDRDALYGCPGIYLPSGQLREFSGI